MAKDYDLWIVFALFQSSVEQPRFHVTKWPNRAKHLKLHLKTQRPALTPLHWTAFQTLTPLEKIRHASTHYVKTYSNARPDSAVCRLWYHEQLCAFVPITNHIFKKIFSSTFSNGFSSSGTTWSHAEAHTNIPLGICWATEAQRERGKEKKKEGWRKRRWWCFTNLPLSWPSEHWLRSSGSYVLSSVLTHYLHKRGGAFPYCAVAVPPVWR